MAGLDCSVLGLKIGALEQIYGCSGHVSNYRFASKPDLINKAMLSIWAPYVLGF